jgi:signal transduction histidine kinase
MVERDAEGPSRSQLFGELLQQLGLVDERQVRQAMHLQQLTGQRLGDALVALGHLRRADLVDALLRVAGPREEGAVEIPRLGEILFRLGHITDAQLKAALEQQAKDHRKLGEILVELKACTHRDVHAAVALQQRILEGDAPPHDDQLAQLRTMLEEQRGESAPVPAANEEEHQHRLADVGRTLASTLHDLRTPLTIIGAYSRLMSNEDDPAIRMRFSGIIEHQLEDLSRMMHATLAYARGEHLGLRRSVRIELLAQELDRELRARFQGTGVVSTVSANSIGCVDLDDGLLKRAIDNLATNSAEAMTSGGTCSLTFERQAEMLVIRFSDDGPGIAPQAQAVLFQPFGTFGKSQGTGLGLAVVKQFADQHGGRVLVHTELGRGTTFEILIPMKR